MTFKGGVGFLINKSFSSSFMVFHALSQLKKQAVNSHRSETHISCNSTLKNTTGPRVEQRFGAMLAFWKMLARFFRSLMMTTWGILMMNEG